MILSLQQHVNATHYNNMHKILLDIGMPREVGFKEILSMLEAEDASVQIHAVRVVANLSTEGFFPFFCPFLIVSIFKTRTLMSKQTKKN